MFVSRDVLPPSRGRVADAALPDGRLDEDDLPASIAFLAGVVDAAILRRVTVAAERADVTAEIVLLNEGHLRADDYYRRLASFLGLPFAERPVRPAASATIDHALNRGIVALRSNPSAWRYLAAPRGQDLAEFIDAVQGRGRSPGLAIAITSPERLEALVRGAQRDTVLRTASHGLPDWNEALSARGGLTAAQAAFTAAVASSVAALAVLDPSLCGGVLHLVFFVAFTMVVCLRLPATAASPPLAPPLPATRLPDHELPVYSVLVPLFRETRVVERLIAALDRLDYPAAKLDIILMVEAQDAATLAALEAMRLPSRYRTIMAARGRPQTKPRALNVALQFVRGDLLVVYDAEDEPDPDQLRLAVGRFAADPAVACLQAKLAIDNAGDSWLTRLFALEYAALFDVINPGLASLRLPVPLGGTSNHFRTETLRRLNGWDAWNVAEDIDLGIRLARFGCPVQTLDSSTFEEAPNRLKPWLTQRTRWLKGWIVTLATHSRHPQRLYQDLGLLPCAAVLALLFGTVASCLLGPFCIAATALRLWSGDLLHPRTAFDMAWSTLSLALLLAGAVSAVAPAVMGLRRRGSLASVGWLALLPLYLFLLSIAAWQAVFEACGRPFAWAKTEHGRAKRRQRPNRPA